MGSAPEIFHNERECSWLPDPGEMNLSYFVYVQLSPY